MSTAIGYDMTFVFQNRDRAKKAAQRIVKALPGAKLSSVQEGLARASGYADWYAFEHIDTWQPPSALDQDLPEQEFRARINSQVIALSTHLGLPSGDVQHALSAARFTGDRVWTLGDHLALRIAAWRRGPLLEAKMRGRGDLIKVRVSGRPDEFGYLLSYGYGGARVLLEDSILHCAKFEVVRPRNRPADFIPSRYWRAYGYWTLNDGSKVLFSRDYYPLWRISAEGVDRLAPWLWIGPRVQQTHFFILAGEPNWRWPKARAMSEAFLIDNGVYGLPMLADAALHHFRPGVGRPEEAVAAEHRQRGAPSGAPDYAQVRDLSAA
jgi:hypothetical protein